MKNIFILIVISLCSYCYCQESKLKSSDTIIISKTLTARPGEYYLDSLKIDITKTYLDWRNIKEMKSFKSKKSKEFDHWAAGAVLITRKKKTPLITLNDFIASAKQGSLKNEENIKIVIDGKLIEDLEGYSIETSCIKKVDILTNVGNGAIIHSDTTPTIIIATKNKKRS